MTLELYAYRAARHLNHAMSALLCTDDKALEDAIDHATRALGALFDEKNRRIALAPEVKHATDDERIRRLLEGSEPRKRGE